MKLVKHLSRYGPVGEDIPWGKGEQMAKRRMPGEPIRDWTLSPEQSAAVDLLATGKTVSEIAGALEVPVQTISEWYKCHPGVQAELNARRQELWAGTADRLRALLPKVLEVLAEELKGENRLHAAVHVLKACRLYGAELPSGSTDVEEIVVMEKERVKKRQQREYFANISYLTLPVVDHPINRTSLLVLSIPLRSTYSPCGA